MTLTEMRRKIDTVLADAGAIVAKTDAEKREMTAEERDKCQALMTEHDALLKEVEMREGLEARAAAVIRPEVGKPVPSGDGEARALPNIGEAFQAIAARSIPGGIRGVEARAISGLNESIGSEGGFLLQPEYTNEILKRAYNNGVLLSACDRRRIGPNSNSLVVRAIDESSRAAGSRLGGVRFYWLAEAAQLTKSKPTFRKMEWVANKAGALWYVTDELLQDSVALAAEANSAFSDELSYELDEQIWNGTGAGVPLGVQNATCLISITKENNQAADTIVFENIVKMWSRMWAPSRARAAWYINQDCEPQLMSMYKAVGVGGVPVYLPAGGLSASPYATLMGRPVIPIEHAATLGDAGDITLADMSQYRTVDKGSPQMAESASFRFDYDEMTFRMIMRFGGMPTWHSVLTPASGSSNTLSPFVRIAERA